MSRPGSIEYTKRHIKARIYRLKWRFGFNVDFYKETQGEIDPRTGKRLTNLTKAFVDRCVVFPGIQHRDIFFSISVIRANSKFVTGGDLPLNDKTFIVDASDLPPNWIPKMGDWVVYEDKRFDITDVEALEGTVGYFVQTRRVEPSISKMVREANFKDKLMVSSEFTYES